MKETTKNQSILQTDYQRGHHVRIVLLVKMQIELASHLKWQRCEYGKENTNCWAIYQGVNFKLNYP